MDVEPVAALKLLADGVRWRIIQLLAAEELCVCHLAEELSVSQPLVSHHLRLLREGGLVESQRFRYWTYYRLRPEVLASVVRRLAALATDSTDRGPRRRPCC